MSSIPVSFPLTSQKRQPKLGLQNRVAAEGHSRWQAKRSKLMSASVRTVSESRRKPGQQALGMRLFESVSHCCLGIHSVQDVIRDLKEQLVEKEVLGQKLGSQT